MKHTDQFYISLKTEIAKMCSSVKSMIDSSITSLVNMDSNLALKVKEDDSIIDRLELEIEDTCLKILALYEPKALDLRFIITALRIIIDLERIGDLCGNISNQVLKLNNVKPLKPYIDLPKMAKSIMDMLQEAIDSYFNKDTALAYNIISKDDYIDQLNDQIIRELLKLIKEEPEKIECAQSLMIISKNYERIADHITNIAELVVFMATGKIIKHKHLKEAENIEDNTSN